MPPSPANMTFVQAVITGILGGGGFVGILGFVRDIWRSKHGDRPKVTAAVREQSYADASIATVAHARDELEADNERLRQILVEVRASRAAEAERFERERSAWEEERRRYRADIAELEEKMRVMRRQHEAQYDALLTEIHELRARIIDPRKGGSLG